MNYRREYFVIPDGDRSDPYRVHEDRGAPDRGRRSRGPTGRASLCPRLQMLPAFGLDEMLPAFGVDEMLPAFGLDEMLQAFGLDEELTVVHSPIRSIFRLACATGTFIAADALVVAA